MLSENVLEELLRATPMREHLVREAWASLTTESRLQIIQTIANQLFGTIPDWLAMLAIDDHAPIVRYWAARSTYIMKPATENASDAFKFLHASTDAERQLYEKAKGDSSELVRICADRGETLSYRTLAGEPQFRRLAFLRSLSTPDVRSFFEWLGRAIDEGVPDAELTECATEFLALPEVLRALERNPDDFPDGGDAYAAGKAIRAGWDVVKLGGPALQRQLAFVLPTRMGLVTIGIDELAAMPSEVVATLPWRTDELREINELVAMMRAHPERFPDEAVKSLTSADNVYLPSGDALVDGRSRNAVDRSRATLDTLIRLKEKVTALASQLELMQQELSSRKGGLFSR
ncbi:hypothetical protein [Paraburkholderia metrosideri]|uniref:Uncharacterized protein n=1 Tax=Paraburkholderia metrosideri TaxID=580937 RepID=A0ABN7HLG0_9BURK|nr:hypothetical protein [Paraburkholderia metrosideri]CAD6525975.1 hypothetical protein LMG28140_01786 [Paraburkholderia metrosideri]